MQDASVLGKTFAKPALAALTARSETEIDPLLASLVRKEILTVHADPRSPERGQYGFLQDLVRRVAYETLSRRERKARHLAAASYLVAAWAADEVEIAEAVASHYLEAYRATPDAPDAADVKRKACDALAQAGERSWSLAAAVQSQRYFEQAADLADEVATRAHLLERAGDMAFHAGALEAGRRHFDDAIELYRSVADDHAAARCEAGRARMATADGKLEEAIERLERAYAVLSAVDPGPDLANVAAELARILYFRGERDRAMGIIERALEVAERLHLFDVLSQALNTKSLILQALSRTEEGMGLLRHALRIALEHDLSISALRAYNNLASLLDAENREEETLEVSAQGLELARKVGTPTWKFMAGSLTPLVLLGRWDDALERAEEVFGDEELASLPAILVELSVLMVIHVGRGDIDEARRTLERFAPLADIEDVQLRAVYDFVAAQVAGAEGRTREALQHAERAAAAREQIGLLAMVAAAIVEAIKASLALGDTARAEQWLQVVEASPPGDRTPYVTASALRFRGRLAAAAQDEAQADRAFRSAEAAFRDISMPFFVGMALTEHAEALVSFGRGEEAVELGHEAREIFERLKARPWIDRVERVGAPTEATLPQRTAAS